MKSSITNTESTFEELKSENKRLIQEIRKLRHKEYLLDLILNNIPQSVYFKDHNGTYTGASKSLAKKFGFADGKDIIGLTDHSFFSDEHCKKISAIEQEILNEGKSFIDTEIEEIWPDGTTTFAINSKLAIKNSNGNNIGIFGISTDITKQKESDFALQNNINFLEVLINTLPAPIFYKDNQGKFQGCNDAFTAFIGRTRDDLINKTVFDIFPDNVASYLLEKDRELFNSDSIQNFEYRLELEDDSKIDVIFHQASFLNYNKEILGLVGGIVNITAQKSAEMKLEEYTEELKKINSNKDRFFSIIAHDLKNPFITLLGFSEALMEDYYEMSPDEHLEYIRQIKVTSKNSFQLLENLLQWSRSQSGKLKIESVDFNISEVVNEVLSLQISASQSKSIKLTNSINPKHCAHSDKDMFKTIMRNLLSNAIKFTESSGTIEITSNMHNDFAEICVSDNGVGISEENIERIFDIDKFHSSSGTFDEEGTGLGLVLCREFVEKNKGNIWVESRLGSGSKFYFTLPVAMVNDS